MLDVNRPDPVARQTPPQIDEFESLHGEPLVRTLDLSTWTPGEDLAAAFKRLDQEVATALAQEDRIRGRVRDIIFSRLKSAPGAPQNAGVYQAQASDLERVQKGLLFNGGVEACDGTMVVHDTIPITITQIGVCLISYNGEQGSWAHRLFRRDLRAQLPDPVDETIAVLERREKRKAQGQEDEPLSTLAGRGIMAYAERALLRDKSQAVWRMGHGNPAPYELLTGWWTNHPANLRMSLDLIRWYVEYKRFVFVPSAPSKRHLLTIGQALNPLEFAIVQTLQPDIQQLIETGHYRSTRPEIEKFRDEVAPHIVLGLYRVWEGAPPYLFYAHEEYAEMAAHIAMADSVLQEHRGFPMMIDLADNVCRATFGADAFTASVQTAYIDAGAPFRYAGEREMRQR